MPWGCVLDVLGGVLDVLGGVLDVLGSVLDVLDVHLLRVLDVLGPLWFVYVCGVCVCAHQGSGLRRRVGNAKKGVHF